VYITPTQPEEGARFFGGDLVAVVPSCENRSAAPCSRQWLREAVVARTARYFKPNKEKRT
jgi:hypothetical protein